MLSPKASNDVTASFGGGCTTTGNVQDALRARASLVVQVTVFVPTGNDDPLIGRQLVLSGAWPPVTVGAPYVTGCADPSSESTGAGAIGHAIAGSTGVGPVPPLPLPPHARAPAHTPRPIKNQERLRIIRSL
jgi:hypothetical protein